VQVWRLCCFFRTSWEFCCQIVYRAPIRAFCNVQVRQVESQPSKSYSFLLYKHKQIPTSDPSSQTHHTPTSANYLLLLRLFLTIKPRYLFYPSFYYCFNLSIFQVDEKVTSGFEMWLFLGSYPCCIPVDRCGFLKRTCWKYLRTCTRIS